MTRRGVLFALATAIWVVASFDAASSSAGAPTRRPVPKQNLPPRREEALAQLFADIRSDNFGHAFSNDSVWGKQSSEIKQGPAFKREKESAELYNSAQVEFYTGDRYRETAAYALRDPKVKFLERRIEYGEIFQYYRLIFKSPESSVRRNNSEFVRERVVGMVLDQQGRFVRLNFDRNYDVLWDAIPHRIESVELLRGLGGLLDVYVSCVGEGDITGTVTLGQAKVDLNQGLADLSGNRKLSAVFSGAEEPEMLEALFVVSVKFSNGATDTVSFKATRPAGGQTVLATPILNLSAFERKAQRVSRRRPADTIVNFIESQNGIPSN